MVLHYKIDASAGTEQVKKINSMVSDIAQVDVTFLKQDVKSVLSQDDDEMSK